MSLLTEEQQQEIIMKYKNGEKAASISRHFGCHKTTVHRVLRNNGIETHNRTYPILTSEQQEVIIARYQAGELALPLAREFGVTDFSIGEILKCRGITKHDISYVKRTSRGYTINEHAFDELTADAAYWAGFLMADGGIVGRRICLDLQARDLGHLHKFRDFLSSNNPIGYRENNNSYFFRVSSAPLCEKLAEYGIVPQKTFLAKAPKFLIQSPDFWRGVIDGDGTIALAHKSSYFHKTNNCWTKPRKEVVLALVGSEKLMNQFAEFVRIVAPSYRGSVRPVSSIFKVATGGNTAKTLIDTLYTNASTVLDRKAEVARQILSS